MKGTSEERFGSFIVFLAGLVIELNQLSEDGWVLLVEGQRDVRAMRSLGYLGQTVTMSSLVRARTRNLGGLKRVVVMTDLDREGRRLAARVTKELSHEGLETSLYQRKRLLISSKGTFRQIENLARFAEFMA